MPYYFVRFVDSKPQLSCWSPQSLSVMALLPVDIAAQRQSLNTISRHPKKYYKELFRS